MSRRLAVAAGIVGAAAAMAGAGLYAEAAFNEKLLPARAATGSRRRYKQPIAAARMLVPQMKRAFAAPGLSVAVAADGKLVWSESCGFADLRRRIPVGRTTEFRVGSLSKAITAAAAVRLSQQGRLDLGADIRRYVPRFPRARPRVTVLQLGGHLGGIRHYRDDEALNTTHYRSLADSLEVFIDDPPVAAPGERFSYSSHGFNLLGAAVEAAGGAPFARAVETAVSRPLGMRSTRLGATTTGDPLLRGNGCPPSGPRTTDRSQRPLPVRRPPLDRRGSRPARARHHRPGFPRRRVTEPPVRHAADESGEATGYAFGLEIHDSPYGVVAGHTGNVVGGTSFLLIHPRTRIVVALTTNIGFVTAADPPDLIGVPDPPQLARPFIRRVLRRR